VKGTLDFPLRSTPLPFNLECSLGHRFYAPRDEWVEWVGKDCLYGAVMRENGQPSVGRCHSALAPIDAQREALALRG
jgi:hypothetical protein